MTDRPTLDQLDEEELAPGSTFTLTEEGWQAVEYVVPGADWAVLSDGGFQSPDGLLRSFPIDDPRGD